MQRIFLWDIFVKEKSTARFVERLLLVLKNRRNRLRYVEQEIINQNMQKIRNIFWNQFKYFLQNVLINPKPELLFQR